MIEGDKVYSIIKGYKIGTIFEVHWNNGVSVIGERIYSGWTSIEFSDNDNPWKLEEEGHGHVYSFSEDIGGPAEDIISHGMRCDD